MSSILSILSFVGGVAAVVLLFFLAIMVHETGHFLAARLLGFKVDAFSICFGPALWKKQSGGVEYRIGCIPLGGYVALPQLDPSSMNAIQGSHGEATEVAPMPAWKRIVVAVAGPAGNIVLAVLLALLVYAFAPESDFGGAGNVVGEVTGERAAACGIRVGDEIAAVHGQPVSSWGDILVESHLAGETSEGLPVSIRREGATLELSIPVVKNPETGFVIPDGVAPWLESEIAGLIPDMPAAGSALHKGDRILSINGTAPTSPLHATRLVRESGTNAVRIVASRLGKRIEAEIIPAYSEELGRHAIGAMFADPAASIPQWMMHRAPWAQIKADSQSIFRMLKALFAPKSRIEQKRAASGMGGPGMLLYMLWNEVHSGIFRSMAFLRFLCINLAILNLLPLPVLDGGHILFAIAELVTRRRPSPKFVDAITTAFAVLLIGLMALLLFRDAVRIGKIVSRPAVESR